MAKVKTVTLYYKTVEGGNVKPQVPIYVDSSSNFYIQQEHVPEELHAVAGDTFKYFKKENTNCLNKSNRIHGDNVAHLERILKSWVSAYTKSVVEAERKKVIVYQFVLQGELVKGELLNEGEDSEYYQCGELEKDLTWSNESKQLLAIGVDWNICFQVKYAEKSHILDKNGKREYKYEDGFAVIEWAQKREDWFSSVEDFIRKTALEMRNFKKATPDVVAKFIDNAQVGSLALPEPKQKKGKK